MTQEPQKSLPIDAFLKKAAHLPVVDVRTPAEFAQGHLPGAINLPLFSNEERAVVGTLYVQQSRQKAVLKGLEFVGPKMAAWAQWAVSYPTLLVHCWRGGMRSASMAWLFEQVGVTCYTLEGGYKAYRTHVQDYFTHLPHTFHVLGGLTGSGKTERLQQMAAAGQPVLDLEALANHKGSAFGGIGKGAQPTNEQFENALHHALVQLDPAVPVWVEDESRNIGKCLLPKGLWEKMETAPFTLHAIPYEMRVQRLLQEYATLNAQELAASIKKIERRMGLENCQKALEALQSGHIETALRLCLAYYDKMYQYQIQNRLK